MRFSGWHILGHATNATNESAESDILATDALVIESVIMVIGHDIY